MRCSRQITAALAAAALLVGCGSSKNSSERACETVTAGDIEQALDVRSAVASPATPGEPHGVCHFEIDDERFPGLPGLPVYGLTISLSENEVYADAIRSVPLGSNERQIDVAGADWAVIMTERGYPDKVITASLDLVKGSRYAGIDVPTVGMPEDEQEDVLLLLAALVLDRWLESDG